MPKRKRSKKKRKTVKRKQTPKWEILYIWSTRHGTEAHKTYTTRKKALGLARVMRRKGFYVDVDKKDRTVLIGD